MVNKKNFKIISIIITLFIISTLISINTISTKANNIATQPNFKITELKATPDSAKVGEDILVSGKIVPEDFEITAAPKEIVLVLDVSGSMKDEIVLDKCMEERRRYCIIHGSDDPNHGWFLHKWIDDYCPLHEEQGEHNIKSTKIEELKKAAKSFIDTMKDVPNLKIAIVKYASNATIVSDLKNINDSSLIASINNLSANGGTNIKEGLRKATYLLNKGESNANKTIVLMTDGNPTYYTTYEELDNKDPDKYGNGSSTDAKTIEYTTNFAKNQIATRNYNAYSIGYGLDTTGTTYLKQIHSSMKGLKDSDEANETNGFFAKSDGSITEIFTQIAENIKNSYELKQVSLDIGINEGFTLNIGGNRVEIGNITYSKISDDTNTGKIRYHADPVNFSFVVKGNLEGYQQIFNNIKINYLWEDAIKSIDINQGVPVTINPNELPSISAKLLSNDKMEIKRNDEITLKYEITPEDFIYNNISNSDLRDVIFLLDISVRSDKAFSEILKGLHDKIMNTDKLKNSNTKYSIITFSNDAKILFDFNYSGTKDKGDYVNSINEVYLKDTNLIQSGNERNIGKALKLVPNVIATSRSTASKNLVIISDKDVQYTESDYINLKNKNYNIITLCLSSSGNNSTLHNLHNYLGGNSDGISYGTQNNNLELDTNYLYGTLMEQIRAKIVSTSVPRPYDFKPTINLNLGDNFNPISGIVRSTENGKNNIGIVEIPTITYNLTQNNNYHAESKIIEIKIKANNLLPGIYTFGNINDNKINYKTLLNNDNSMTIKTPIITVKEEVKDVSHGLYNGISSGKIYIQENNNGKPFEIAQGSTATFGASFTFSGSSIDFQLNVDNKFSTLNPSNIKIYKVLKDSYGNATLKELDATNKVILVNGDNKFNIAINNIDNSSNEILVLYQSKIIDTTDSGQALINEIVFSSISKETTIITPNQSTDSPTLPDLF